MTNNIMDDKILNTEQKAAVSHESGPLLIIAGAGTGKTTVITERVKHLIQEKAVSPSNILALTFTEKAAREMEERIDMAMPLGYSQMFISTFHAFCDKVLRAEAIHIGLNPSYKLMTPTETVLFLRRNLFEFDLKYFRPLGNPNKFLEALIGHFSRLKDEDIKPQEYLDYSKKLKTTRFDRSAMREKEKLTTDHEEAEKTAELAKAFAKYEGLKVKEGVMDFADLISNTLHLLRTRKNILRQYQEKFKYILVDEFQDTNYAQNELAILLAGAEKNIAVVGDDDQAIYRWRGAAVSNIMQFKKHFPTVKIVILTKNYRSTQAILDHSYNLIQFNNPDRLEIKENISKKLTGMRKIMGQAPKLIYEDRVENEADEVAKEIKILLNKHPEYTLSDVAILVRANDHSQPFARALGRLSIPYQFLGPGQLFQQEEIKDLIAYLKVLYNFEDNVSLYRVLSMDHFGLSPRHMATILNFARRKNLNLLEAMENINDVILPQETKDKVNFILKMIDRHLKKAKKDTAGQILYYFLEDSGLLKTMFDYKTRKDEQVAQNISRLFDKFKTYEVEHDDASVQAVIDWIDLSMQMGESPLATDTDWSGNNAVNILTVHSSKGLEFPVVFLVNLVRDRFPSRERREQIPVPDALVKEELPEGDYHLEEERRIFYVGMTRARDILYFTAANYYGEGKRERKLSPFVSEVLGPDLSPAEKAKDIQLTLLEWSGPNAENEAADLARASNAMDKPVIEYLSYSQMEAFKTCPLHYKARYILKLPVPSTAAQSFGTSVHAALNDYYLQVLKGEKPKEETLFSLLDKNWINEGYLSRVHEKQMKERGKEIMRTFLGKFHQPTSTPLALEQPFIFKITNGNKLLKIGGKIDRVDKLEDGRIEIIDYKTGANEPRQTDLDKNLQLTVYALAASQIAEIGVGKKPDEVALSLYYLESGNIYTTTRTAEDLERAKQELFEIADRIANSDFACSRGNLCINCEYKMLCNRV